MVHSLPDSFTDSHLFLLHSPTPLPSLLQTPSGHLSETEIARVAGTEVAHLLLPMVGRVLLWGHQPRDPAVQGRAGRQGQHGAQATESSSVWAGQAVGEGEVGPGVKSVRVALEDVVSCQSIGLDPERVLRVWRVRVGWFSFDFFFLSLFTKDLGRVLAAQSCTFQILLGAGWGMDWLVFSSSRLLTQSNFEPLTELDSSCLLVPATTPPTCPDHLSQGLTRKPSMWPNSAGPAPSNASLAWPRPEHLPHLPDWLGARPTQPSAGGLLRGRSG